MGPLTGEDGVARCPWAGGPGVMRDYHDREWGRSVHGEAAYLERLMQEPRIVRNRMKIDAAVTNAGATVALREQEGLEAFVLSFAPSDPPGWHDTAEMPTTSAESTALSKALKKRGFAFVGPTTMHALMEAIGVFDPHLRGCFRHGKLS